MLAETATHLPARGTSAAAARRFISRTLHDWGLDHLQEVACLLVSELVSNVVLHARTDLDVRVRRGDGRVRVEVCDGDRRLPERRRPSPTSSSGRGLLFVSELAEAWGAEPAPGGKCVWFEVRDDREDRAAGVPVAAAASGRDRGAAYR